MPKITMISVRTTDEFSDVMKQMADRDKTTVSGFINTVLGKYLESQTGQELLRKDRRKFPRLHKSIPAYLELPDTPGNACFAGKITNLSMGGISLIIPRHGYGGNVERRKLSAFGVVFSLPQSSRPITIQCRSQRIQQHRLHFQVGACYDDVELASYQALQSFLCK